jgi:ferrous iron transport protein B
MLATFMPCGAKLPVIALFAGAFFPESKWVSCVAYMGGIVLVLLGALIIKVVTAAKFRKSFFIIELPEYKVPSLKFAFFSMLERGKAYIIKAGTIILVCNTVVQIMQSFNWSFQVVEEGLEDTSILASISRPFAYLLIPIVGVAAWQLAAAAITGFIAKENVVGTIATVYAITNLVDPDELELVGEGNAVAVAMGITKVAALAYLLFNLYTPPCFAALGAMNSEMQSKKWLWGAIGLQLATGFTVGFLVYQIGTLITTGTIGAGFLGGLLAVICFAIIIISIAIRNKKQIALEYKMS